MYVAPVEKCPHCDSKEGFYTKDYIKGSTIYRHNFDGSEAENGDYYDFLDHKTSKYVYCLHCKKRLFEVNDLEVI